MARWAAYSGWAALAVSACAAAPPGPWELRYGRTVDAATSGGWPTYRVTCQGSAERLQVDLADEATGAARGSVLLGQRVTVPTDRLLTLAVSYTAVSAEANRRPRLELVVLTPAAWDALGQEPRAEAVFNSGDRAACLGSVSVLGHVGEDVGTATPLDTAQQQALAYLLRRQAGRPVVVAVALTGLHGAVEAVALQDLQLTALAPRDPAVEVLQQLDLERPELAGVKQPVAAGDHPAAWAALLAAYRARRTPVLPGSGGRAAASARTIEEADATFQNRFIGQGNYGLQAVPTPLDWSFNPGQDPEWTWQFNRHSAWQALAAAYRATGDEKYAQRWLELLRSWVEQNPPGTPWSWRTIEAGIRGQGWPAVYGAFLASPSLTPHDHALLLGALADHARYLLPAGRFSSGSNWGMIESQGLFSIGTWFPEFRDAATWRATAWQRIEGELDRQVLPDGAQVELTTGYHLGVLDLFLKAADLAKLGGVEPQPAFFQRLERMYEYSACLSKPDGSQPMPGDSWPGSVRGALTAGGRRFNRPDLLYIGTAGREGSAPDYLDTHLPDAGYYVMRTSWTDPQGIYLLHDIAHRWGGGHQHPDALQVDLYAYGATLLPDTGSYLYYGPGRAAASRTAAHNTVCLDEANQNTSAAQLHAFASRPALSFSDGEHSGYPGVTTRRQVLFARPDHGAPPYFVVIDRVTGSGEHVVDQSWHFRPGPAAVDAASLTARTTHAAGANLLVQALDPDGVALESIDSFVSFTYTVKEPRPAVRFRRRGPLPQRFVTLLLPYPGATAPAVTARLLPSQATGAVQLEVSGAGFRDQLFAGLGSAPAPFGEGTARAGLRRVDPTGRLLAEELVSDLPPR